MTTERGDLPLLAFPSSEAWEAWLSREHETAQGVWLKIAKKGAGIRTVTYAEALDIALCYGWIDGQKGAFDDSYFLQRFTPRRRKSRWSMINRDKATALLESGSMQPAGLREIEAAQADGRWEAAYAGQASATLPDDLQRALEENPRALEAFRALDRVNRYAILHRIGAPGSAQTRARRIEKYVTMLEAGGQIYP